MKKQSSFEEKLKAQLDGTEMKPSDALWNRIEQNMYADSFEPTLQDKLENYAVDPRQDVWDQVELQLPEAKRKRGFFWLGSVSALLLATFVAGFWFSQMDSTKLANNDQIGNRQENVNIAAQDAGSSEANVAAKESNTASNDTYNSALNSANKAASNAVNSASIKANKSALYSANKAAINANNETANNAVNNSHNKANKVSKTRSFKNKSKLANATSNETSELILQSTSSKSARKSANGLNDLSNTSSKPSSPGAADLNDLSNNSSKPSSPGAAKSRKGAAANQANVGGSNSIPPVRSEPNASGLLADGPPNSALNSSSAVSPNATKANASKNNASIVNATKDNASKSAANSSNESKTTDVLSKQHTPATEPKVILESISVSASPKDSFEENKIFRGSAYMAPEESYTNFSITAFAGIHQSMMQLSMPSQTPYNNLDKSMDLRNEMEAPSLDFSGGLLLNYQIGKHWMVSSGIAITSFTQKVDFSVMPAKQSNPALVQPTNNYINPKDSIIMGSANSFENKYSFTEIPLYVSYKFPSESRVSFELMGGFSFGKLNLVNAYMPDPGCIGVLVVNDKASFPEFSNVFFATLAPNVAFKLNSSVDLGIMPTVKTSLNSMVKNEQWIQQKPWLVGLGVYLRKRF
ncbi:MAG: outer membrane beta-barrel protein [bacterium]|nr:outer membrane beta-barrel protein [bacterium]